MKRCEACNGTGWIPGKQVIGPIVYSGVRRCVCNPKAEAPAEPAKKRQAPTDFKGLAAKES